MRSKIRLISVPFLERFVKKRESPDALPEKDLAYIRAMESSPTVRFAFSTREPPTTRASTSPILPQRAQNDP